VKKATEEKVSGESGNRGRVWLASEMSSCRCPLKSQEEEVPFGVDEDEGEAAGRGMRLKPSPNPEAETELDATALLSSLLPSPAPCGAERGKTAM
jgi:hypothetical protein